MIEGIYKTTDKDIYELGSFIKPHIHWYFSTRSYDEDKCTLNFILNPNRPKEKWFINPSRYELKVPKEFV